MEKYLNRIVFWFGLNLIFCNFSFAQNKDFTSLLKAYKKVERIDFSTFEKDFEEFKNDSSKMNQLLNEIDFEFGQSYALNALGIIARNTSNYSHSLELHQRGLAIAEKINNQELIIAHLNMMGVTYRRLDDVRQALDFHKKALSLAEKIPNKSIIILKSIAVSLNSIGNVYLVLKQYDLAKTQFSKSIEIEKKVGNKLGLAINYQNLGGIYEAKNELDEALKNYRNSLKYNKEINSKLGIIICNNSIGQIYIKQNKPIQALKLILPTLKFSEEMGDKYYLALTAINIGWGQTKIKDFVNAERNLYKGLKISLDNSFKTSTSDAYAHLADLFEAQGKFQQALENLKKKQEFSEKVLNEENLRYTAELIVKYDNEKKESQIKLLEKENEIVKFKLDQNNRIILFSLALFVFLTGILFVFYRQYQLRNQKRVLTLEQDMMRSQMNPHFLFNSLNSIKLYIINNDKEKAVYFINKFSKLIRAILSNSREKEISLEEELETMNLYVNIENIRFLEQIKYEVIIEKEVDIARIKIPSLILQPFIENAIWHGLSNIETDKQLKIYISKRSTNLICFEIIDNGIGRNRAKEIKEAKISKDKSVGLKLTKERLENFANKKKGEVVIEFEDLVDSKNKPLGTKLIIVFPVK